MTWWIGEIAEIIDLARDDAAKAAKGADLNPFSTQGARTLWQRGWDNDLPALLTFGSLEWRYWERGKQARLIAHGGR